MIPAKNISPQPKNIQSPIACINSQDESITHPIREFLLAYGCKVYERNIEREFLDYHIVCGTAGFVEEFFTSVGEHTTRRLAIVLDDQEPEVGKHTKIVFIDSGKLEKETLAQVLKFFFTDSKQVLDLRKNPKTTTKNKVQDSLPLRAHVPAKHDASTFDADDERITKMIAEIFHDRDTRSRNKKNKRKFWVKLNPIVVLVLVIIFPFFWYTVNILASALLTVGSAKALVGGHMRIASKTAEFSRIPNAQARLTLGLIAIPFQLADYHSLVRNQERLISLFQDISIGISGAVELLSEGQLLATDLLSRGDTPQGVTPAESVERIRNELFSLHTRVNLAHAELTSLISHRIFPFWLPFIVDRGSSALTTIASFTSWIDDMDRLLLLYPRIAGFNGKKTYLLILQNSMELRPTGGFIGSVATVTVEEGRLMDIEVQDVYALDGQLKGHVDPPRPLRDILGQEHWYLRDSNWHPNFTESGERAAWFYEKETGTRVDGVIGISVPFITKILQTTGPISLSDYNDQITSENFFGKSLYYTQADFFPGSTQKKDFLGNLTTALLTSLTTQAIRPTAVFSAITESLASHDFLFYFVDSELESLVTEFGWAGNQLPTTGCSGTLMSSCLFDPSYVVEANLGVNKANYFVSRNQTREITIAEDGTIEHAWNLRYHNASSGQAGSGPYTAYSRFYLPVDSAILSVTLDGVEFMQKNSEENTAIVLPYRDLVERDGDYVIHGIAFRVNPGEDRTVIIRYTRGQQLLFQEQRSVYEAVWPRQPGTASEDLSVIVRFPVFWSALDTLGRERLVANDRELEYNRTLEVDQTLRITFIK